MFNKVKKENFTILNKEVYIMYKKNAKFQVGQEKNSS